MIYKQIRFHYWTRMSLILITFGIFVLCISKTDLDITPLFLVIILILQIAALLHQMEKPQRDMNRFFDAIRYSDFSQTFSDTGTDKSLAPMKEAFSKVMEAFQKTREEKEAHYRYLQTMVQHVGVGLMVFQPDGRIDMMNQALRKILGISNIRKLETLRKIKPSLPEQLTQIQPGEKNHIRFYHPETHDLITLSIYTTRFIIRDEAYTLASIQNIQSELEEKELEAWQNLIRVLTHEIMNSITPIASLASTAKGMLKKMSSQKNQPIPVEDITQAVQTIEMRSKGLLNFVDSYRQLTRIPQPDFQIVPLMPLIERIQTLMRPKYNEKRVQLEITVHPTSIEVTADPALIEQVLINLLKNALDWCLKIKGGKVCVRASMGGGGRPIIQIIDNGPGIQKEALEKIFIPFFTTKEDGTGIGLSLSRQIMRLHKGTITAQSRPNHETIITLRF